MQRSWALRTQRSVPQPQASTRDGSSANISISSSGSGVANFSRYASYYLTGYLYGRPLARVRETLKQLGLERTEGQSEPEDHAAVLLEVMAGLASGQIVAPGETARDIFETHLKPWIGRFFSDLEHAQSAKFYACVGTLGRIFTEVEAEAFSLSE